VLFPVGNAVAAEIASAVPASGPGLVESDAAKVALCALAGVAVTVPDETITVEFFASD
jgi:hypothetical protein